MKHKHSYATQRLMENGFSFYHNRKKILQYPFTEAEHWVILPIETKIQLGIPFLIGESSVTKKITDYDDLLRYGVMVSKRKPKIQRFFAQKIEYFLSKMSSFKVDVGDIPEGHHVEINPRTREFKLIGRSSDGKWFNPNPKRSGEFQQRKNIFDQRGSSSYFDTIKKHLPIKDEAPEYSDIISEIVLGITEDGKLVCLQEERENPVIGIIGKKRNAKSLIKHRIEDQMYHKWKKKGIELNDVMMETDSYCQRWIPKPITKFSNMDFLNEPTIPLPMVYLHPKTTTLRNLIAKDETGFEVYFSYQEFIKNFNNNLKGREELKFKGSNIYFENLLFDIDGKFDKEGLYYCKNYADMEKVINTKFNNSKLKIPDGVPPRIKNVLKNIDNSKIWDISNKTKAKWKVEYPDGHTEEHFPWIACIIADLFPSIVTNNLKNNHPESHPIYMNFILQSLYNNQNENDYFRKNKIELFMFFDEILSVTHSPSVVETFETIVRESGHSLIGFTYCSQYWDKIPEFIRSQTDYVISFQQKKNQAKAIVQDFDAFKHREKDLINLKKGEFIIFSSNPLVLIDEYGKKEYVEDAAIKATVFPPNSAHKAPKNLGA